MRSLKEKAKLQEINMTLREGDRVVKETDRYRYIARRGETVRGGARRGGGGEVLYLQMRNKRGGWGREIRASPLKTGGFGKAYRNQIFKHVETRGREGVPTPSNYKVNTTRFIDGTQSFRLVNTFKQATKSYRLPQLDITPRTKSRTVQFNLDVYKRAEIRQDDTLPGITINGVKYQLTKPLGQYFTIVVDVDKMKHELWKKWQKGWKVWEKYDGVDGEAWLTRLSEVLIESGVYENMEAGQAIQNYMSAVEGDVIIQFSHPRKPANPSTVQPISFLTQRVQDDARRPPMLDSRYTSYYSVGGVEGAVVYRNVQNYKPNLCALSVILETYRAPQNMNRLVERRRTSFINLMTYEALVAFLFPNRTLAEIQERGICFDELVPFFRQWKIAFYVYDVYNQLRHSFVPEELNQTIRPNVIRVQQHERHYYLMNNELPSLGKTDSPVIERGLTTTKTQVSFYYQRDRVDDDRVFVALTMEECVALIHTTNQKAAQEKEETKNEIKPYYVYTRDELLPALVFYLRKEWNMKVSVSLRSTSQIKSIKFNACTITSVCNSRCGELTYEKKDELAVYLKWSVRLYNSCFGNPAWRSEYNELTYRLLSENKPRAIRGSFSYNKKVVGYTKYDFSLYYTNILCEAEWLLRINGFDTLERYDGGDVDDYSLYYVEKIDGDRNTYPYRKYSLVYGKALKTSVSAQVEILGVLRVSHRVKNHVADKYRQALEDKELAEIPAIRKFLLNSTTGQFGCHLKSAWNARIFDSLEEAAEIGGGVRHFCVDGEQTDLYLQYTKVWKVLKDGYMPIHHWVVEQGIIKILQLREDLESVGYVVHNINTDCCDVGYDEEAEKRFREKFGEKYASLKTEHHKEKRLSIDKPWSVVLNDCFRVDEHEEDKLDEDGEMLLPNDELRFDEKEAVEVKGYDEWDVESVHRAIVLKERGNVCCVEAIYPGSGKSWISKKFAGRKLFVCPTNQIAIDLMDDGHDAVTLDTLFSSRMGRGGEMVMGELRDDFLVGGEKRCLWDYDYITFEELTLCPVDKIFKVKDFIEKQADKFKAVICNYDPFQNKSPDEKLDNIRDVRAYKLKICRSITGRYVLLREMKRNGNEENFKHYKALFEMLQKNDRTGMVRYMVENFRVVQRLEDIVDEVALAYTNPQCDRINQHTYARLHGDKPWSIGMKMIYRGKSQFIGKCKTRFFKNAEYEITAIDGNKYTLGGVALTLAQVKANFRLPYCKTGHSTQGSTIKQNYTIDINSSWCDCAWLWTALTRCTDIGQITIYYNENEIGSFQRRLRGMCFQLLRGYIEQDKAAGRSWKSGEYMTLDWMVEKLKCGACCYCGEPFDLSHDMGCFSFDRIDGEKAHTKDNVQVVCRYCNSIKR